MINLPRNTMNQLFYAVFFISLGMLLIGTLVFRKLNKVSSPEKARERNLKLISYTVLVFFMLCAINFISWLLYLFCALLVLVSVTELIRAARIHDKNPYLALIIAAPVFYLFIHFILKPEPELHLFVYFIVINFDGYSQVLGESFGKRKLLPAVSPGKTIAGLLGGSAVAIFLGLILLPFFSRGETWYQVLGFTVLIITAAFSGDILASAYKRYCGIKDYSNLIPGHGGVLDRFDSFFMAGAVTEILLALANK
jgi:phosphatidate cytidylyltransferase